MTNEEILNTLTPQEREHALKILSQLKTNGSSEILDKMRLEDYKEVPVDINTFMHDERYLGKGLTNVEGKFTVFPYWVETLNKVFPNNTDTAYNTLILSGAIGLGKSFVAVIAMLYMLYRMMCLKDPYLHYGLQSIDKITFSFLNITKEAAKGVAWTKCQELLQMSPWFMERGRVSQSLNPEWQPKENIELLYGSQPRHVIGRAVFCSFEDEISFIQNSDVEKQKEKAKALISSVDARMQSRFMHGERLPTLHILASSKRTDQSFLETYIDMKKKNESKTTLIIDEPQWVIRTDKDSPNKFNVALGNKFLESEVLPLDITEKEIQSYIDRGYTILKVPMGYYENFRDDLDIALTDIAGISTSNAMKYINGVRWSECRDDTLKNPFTKEILVVGNAKNDNAQYSDFFDMTRVPKDMMSRPLYIHLDMSISGDKTGIAGTWIRSKTASKEGENSSKSLFYQLAFAVSIKAPKGYQISFEKNRNFIYWLREQGFNIKGISTDTFQSYDTGQQLKAKGFNTDVISVDRVGSDRICQPYLVYKNAIYEKRYKTFKQDVLTEEIVNLERNGNGKIDHPLGGTVGSKDCADACCGSLFNASQHAEEFAYDFGEDLSTTFDVNDTPKGVQLEVDFEKALNEIHDPLKNYKKNNNDNNNNSDTSSMYAYDGIMVW